MLAAGGRTLGGIHVDAEGNHNHQPEVYCMHAISRLTRGEHWARLDHYSMLD